MLYDIYRFLTDLGRPVVRAYLRRRLRLGKEDAARFEERFGSPTLPRPEGRLVWCHAASVGEAMSFLLLIEKMHDLHSDLAVLLTTGTVTAARTVAPRLPSYARHQYVPVDLAPAVARFLDHWRPELALWIESELWPNTLAALRARKIPAVLLNARMSERSFRHWLWAREFAREMMSGFGLCLAQTEADRGRFEALGATDARCVGNLKYASSPLPVDGDELARLRLAVAGRELWLMASTHRGEEEMALAAHRELHARRSRTLTVIVPRHAARGEEIAQKLALSGVPFARRSKGELPAADTQIYLADTMGELGLFYALCPVAVLGGSFVRVGGHNPVEAAHLGAAIVFGRYMFNFSEISREFLSADAAIQLRHENEIAATVERLFADGEERARRAHAARALAESKRGVLDRMAVELDPWLKRRNG